MSEKNANDEQKRVVPQNPMVWGDIPEGETEPRHMVEPGDVAPDKDRKKELNAARHEQYNVETEPGQTEPWDMLHPGEQKED